MAIDFMEGLASTVNDALNPLFDLAKRLCAAVSSLFHQQIEHSTTQERVEPFR